MVQSRRVLRDADREVIGWWLLTRLGLLSVAMAAPYLFGGADEVPSLLDRWRQWDVWHFERIATHGYFDPGWSEPVEAFFPGLPLLLRAGSLLGVPTIAVGLVISLVAGGIAAVALARLAAHEFGPEAGRYAALAWMVAPPAVFLAAPYTESLFLACAIPAWLAARNDRWALALGLAAGACTVRISGVFLVVALGVLFLTTRSARSRPARLAWFALPAIPVAGYALYLWAHTGDWLRWYNAQSENWNRGLTWPHDAFANTWQAAFSGEQTLNFMWMFRAELVAMAVGVAVTVLLLYRRWWGSATWIGLQVAAFGSSSWFFSVPRASLLWFPLWVLLGALGVARTHRVWWWRAYLAIAVPLCVVWAAAFLVGRWAG